MVPTRSKQLAQAHAAWFAKVGRELLNGAPPTWDQVEFLLAEEFEHGYKHGVEDESHRAENLAALRGALQTED